MFQHILVPLDGSNFAETALPYALALSTKFDSEITLVRIAEGVQTVTPSIDAPLDQETAVFLTQLSEDLNKDAQEYLQDQCIALRQQGYKAHKQLIRGSDVAACLLEVVEAQHIDVIVMCTHGRGGIRRWIFGSVAEKLLRHAPCPVLLIRADETAVASWKVGSQES